MNNPNKIPAGMFIFCILCPPLAFVFAIWAVQGWLYNRRVAKEMGR